MLLLRRRQIVLHAIAVIIVTWACTAHSSSDYIPFAFQSGGDSERQGDITATGLVYDATNRILYLTGDTYGSPSFQRLAGAWDPNPSSAASSEPLSSSDCFLGMLQLPQAEDQSPTLTKGLQFGVTEIADSCTAIELSKNGKIYIAGNSFRSAGVLTPLAKSTVFAADGNDVTGLILNFDVKGSLEGGLLIQEQTMHYPMATDRDLDSDRLFVVSLVMRGVQNHKDRRNGAGGSAKRYAVVQKLSNLPRDASSINKIETTLHVDWRQPIFLNDDSKFDLGVTSLAFHQGLLFVGGSTTGEGPAVGKRNVPGESDTSNIPFPQRVWNGYVTKLNAKTGAILSGLRILSSPHDGQDDRVWGVCTPSSPVDDPQVSHVVYAVGETTGIIITPENKNDAVTAPKATSAFLVKVNTDSMTVVWTRQLAAKKRATLSYVPAEVTATSCAVSPDGEVVYVAGTTSEDAVLDLNKNSDFTKTAGSRERDVFVAQYTTRDGQFKFARQIGTAKDDWLSYGRTVVTDDHGHAILTGNTQGPLFRPKTSSVSDLFVVSIHKDTGEYETTRSAPASSRHSRLSNSKTQSNNNNSSNVVFLFLPGFVSMTVIAAVVALVGCLLFERLFRRRFCFRKGGHCPLKKT